MKNFLIEAYNRFKAPTPVFFKKLIVFGGSLGVGAASMLAINGIPQSVINICQHAATIGAAIVVIAKMAVTNTSDTTNP